MFATQNFRPDFADTRVADTRVADTRAADSTLAFSGLSRFDTVDGHEQLALAGAADSHLLRMVMCVACATIMLALISSLA